MKETCQYYDFLRRSWRLLLLGLSLGALLGFAFYSNQTHDTTFSATASVGLYEDESAIFNPASAKTILNIDLGSWPSQEEAIKASSKAFEIASLTGFTAVAQNVFLVESKAGDSPWKPVVFGSIIGFLLVIGVAYVWDDAKAYRRHLQEQT